MIVFPREVRAGDKISATEYNRLVRAVRAIYPVQGPGMRLKTTPNGTVFEAAFAKATPAPAAGRVVPGAGCFALVEDAEPTEDTSGTFFDMHFANKYWLKGNRIFTMTGDTKVSSLVGLEVNAQQVTATLESPYVALKIPAIGDGVASLEAYASFTDLADAANDTAFALAPLYLFSAEVEEVEGETEGETEYQARFLVDVDFRNIPRAQVVEILPT